MNRILAVAGLTMKESARKRVALGMIVCSVLMTLALGLVARAMEQQSEGNQMGLALAVSTLLRVVAGFTWVLALFISVTAIPQELERRTIYTLFAKPVDRWEWVLGKFLGCCGLLAANIAVIGVIIAAMLTHENPSLAHDILLNLLAFFVSYTALIALGVALTLVLPMMVAGLVALGLYFLGSAYGFGNQVAQTTSIAPIWRGLGRAIYYFGQVASPRTNWLNTDRPLITEVSGHTQWQAALVVLAYSLAVLFIASVAFSRREL